MSTLWNENEYLLKFHFTESRKFMLYVPGIFHYTLRLPDWAHNLQIKDTSYVWGLTGHGSLWLEWKAIYLIMCLCMQLKNAIFQLILGSCIASILKVERVKIDCKPQHVNFDSLGWLCNTWFLRSFTSSQISWSSGYHPHLLCERPRVQNPPTANILCS